MAPALANVSLGICRYQPEMDHTDDECTLMQHEATALLGLRKRAMLQLLIQTRDIVNEILDTGDVIGQDDEGRTLIQLAVDPMMLDELCVYDAATADLEPDADLEDETV